MPTYAYRCEKCRKTFEIWQKITEDPLKKCTDRKCRGKVKRLVNGGGGFILKGSGFYATDYRKPAKKEETKKAAETPAAKPAPAKTET